MHDAAGSSIKRMSVKRITVLIADDQALVRHGIKKLVRDEFAEVDFLEVDNGDSLSDALNASRSVRVALVDLNIPRMQGGRRLAEFARLHQQVSFVAISVSSSPDIIRDTMNIPSVCAFVPKRASIASVRMAFSAAIQGKKLSFAFSCKTRSQLTVTLTLRQEEIRNLMRYGMTNKTIAATLGISEGTVKNHITKIFRGLKATNRTQAAQFNAEAN